MTMQTTPKINSITVRRQPDLDPDLSWLEQTDEQMGEGFEASSRERLEAYNRGDWEMVGVDAVAEVVIGGVIQTIQSGGLWGIETDSDESYFTEVANEELASLAGILAEIGCSDDDIREATAEAR